MPKKSSTDIVQFDDIEQAEKTLKNYVIETQVSHSGNTSQLLGSEVFFKHENEQRTGSFKVRGALNKMSSLTEEEKKKGVIASSAGNHAQGVAFSAQQVGVPATIVMPNHSPIIKAKATQHYGANIIFHGEYYDEAYHHALTLEKERGLTFIHPFNDPKVIAGQGTIGLEIFKQIPDLDSVVISIGGGGLMSGVATAIKHLNPNCKIYGVVSAQTPNMLGKYKGKPEDYPFISGDTIADGIAVKEADDFILDSYIKRLVDDIVSVTDDEICESLVWLLERSKTVVEGCSAATLAGAKKANWDLGKKTCLMLSGGNIDLNMISQVIERGLMQTGRLSRVKVLVKDRPGQMLKLAEIIADHSANVLEVQHDRLVEDLSPKMATIEFLIECKDTDHLSEIKAAIESAGGEIL